MNKVWRYSEDQLRGLLGEVGDMDAWRGRVMVGLKSIFHRWPLRYRGYGPYWWLLKKEFVESGMTEFGTHIDLAWWEQLDYGDQNLNIMAACLYGDETFERGVMNSAEHFLESAGDDKTGGEAGGDTIHYVSDDEEMEGRRWALEAAKADSFSGVTFGH